jgi:RecB family exonuclease
MSHAWSYSSIKTFDQCPKKYYHLKVAKDVKDTPGEAAVYGTDVHAAAEEYVKNGTPIPEKYKVIRPLVEALAAFPGEKHTEMKLGLEKTTEGFYLPCGFFDKNVWYRGIVDLVIINGDKAHLIDYKTGKKYDDHKGQCSFYAMGAMIMFPWIRKVNVVTGTRWPPRSLIRM